MSQFILFFDGENTNGASRAHRSPLSVRTYSASMAGTGAISALVTFQGSNDDALWNDIGSVSLSGSDSASGSTAVTNTSTYTRAVISLLAGTGAAVTAGMEAASIPAGVVVGTTDTQTLTNKRIQVRVVALTDAGTITPNADTTDQGNILTVSQTSAIANPNGTPTDGQLLKLRVKSASTQTISFGTQFRATATALPTATAGSAQTERWVFEWNAADSKWDCLSTNAGA